MRQFMDKDFLLHNRTAIDLFHIYAEHEPIFDYHCHLDPRQIAQNKRFETITDIWLGGDHYKWRAMRTVGIDEQLITGTADPYDIFLAWADTLPQVVGNPLYHWSHLELQRYFGIDYPLNRSTARRVWDQANELLASDELSVAGILAKFGVHAVGTTDDPVDTLETHAHINSGAAPIGAIPTRVLPSFRPDKALLVQNPAFCTYIDRLGLAAGIEIHSVGDVKQALQQRLVHFASQGCKASDHGLAMVPFRVVPEEEIEAIFQRARAGEALTNQETEAYQTHVLVFLARLYAQYGIVMQLHLNAVRSINPVMLGRLGPDTGFDATHDLSVADKLASFLGLLEQDHLVPKTILYSLNPNDYYSMGTIMGAFQGGGIPGKMQLGSAWWFCDHKDGMEEQMRVLANLGSLPRFVGMLTDSRSFLSYPRHEYFRRIVCNLLGTWAEEGEIPHDTAWLGEVVRDICFRNAQRYFS